MELRQLVYFEAVARLGGFSRAAEQLHIAQPAVSAQIKRLEAELGARLFDRTTRRVVLTHAGELLLVRARSVLDQLDGARTDLDELAGVLRGHLRVAATPVVGSLDLPRLLAQFHRSYPDVTITLRSGLVAELLADVDSGAVDVVVAPLHADLPAKYVGQPLVAEHLVLVTPLGHRPGATLASVADEPFVCLPAGSGLRAILVDAARAEGFEPRVPFETHSPASIRDLVAAGLGVALLAESAARAPGPDVEVHELSPAPAHPAIGLIHSRRTELTPTARAWRRHLQRTVGQLSQAGSMSATTRSSSRG